MDLPTQPLLSDEPLPSEISPAQSSPVTVSQQPEISTQELLKSIFSQSQPAERETDELSYATQNMLEKPSKMKPDCNMSTDKKTENSSEESNPVIPPPHTTSNSSIVLQNTIPNKEVPQTKRGRPPPKSPLVQEKTNMCLRKRKPSGKEQETRKNKVSKNQESEVTKTGKQAVKVRKSLRLASVKTQFAKNSKNSKPAPKTAKNSQLKRKCVKTLKPVKLLKRSAKNKSKTATQKNQTKKGPKNHQTKIKPTESKKGQNLLKSKKVYKKKESTALQAEQQPKWEKIWEIGKYEFNTTEWRTELLSEQGKPIKI